MKITGIKQQAKFKERFSVYVDGEFCFGIDSNSLLGEKLRVGQEVDEARIEELKTRAELGKWYVKCLEKLYKRPHSIKEIRDYLAHKDQKNIVNEVIARLEKDHKLNDLDFARWFAENRQRAKQRSGRMIQNELRARGVSREIIEEILPEYLQGEHHALGLLIEKKRRLTRYQNPLKLTEYLVRQGYAYGDIKQALSRQETE